MKRTNILMILAATVVSLLAVSCTTSQVAADDNFERGRQVGNRIYIDDPYAGTIVLERDPYTGRYYDVTYGYGYGYGISPYNSRYNPYYRTYRYPTRVTPQRPTEEQRQERQQSREEARRKVLSNN